MAEPYVRKAYQQSEKVNQAEQAFKTHQETQKPADYVSQYQGRLDELYGKINDRKPFQYSINGDTLYQQAAQRYIQQGRQAMMDTMGQAAALTGGYGNSYAQTVGQQTYQGYLQGINDMLPQFYQMALDQYNSEGDNLRSLYEMTSQREGMDYDRYMDALAYYQQELSRLESAYRDERNFDYGIYSDDEDAAYKSYRDQVADDQWQRQFNENVRQFNENMAFQREQAARAAAYGGGRSSGSGSSGNTGGSGLTYSPSNVISLGYGPISQNTLSDLVSSGSVGYTQSGNNVSFYNTGNGSSGGSTFSGLVAAPSVYSTPNPTSLLTKKGNGGR